MLTDMVQLKEPPHPPLCVITNHPARHKDPKTGLPFYNAYAFKEIQKLVAGNFRWSKLTGTWVGNPANDAAEGVPERFLRPETEEERKERTERIERKKQEAAERKEQEKKVAEEGETKAAVRESLEETTPSTTDPTTAPNTQTSPHPPASALGLDPEPAPAPAAAITTGPTPPPAGVPLMMPTPDDDPKPMIIGQSAQAPVAPAADPSATNTDNSTVPVTGAETN